MPLISAPDNRTEHVNIRQLAYLATSNGDFAPVVAAAQAYALANNYKGLYAPGSTSSYRYFKPGPQQPSISISGVTDFEVIGDGLATKFQMCGDGGSGSWAMVQVAGGSQDIRFRDIWFDGNSENLTNLDDGQHTHTVMVGEGNGAHAPGSAKRISFEGCRFTDTDGDGIAIIPKDAAFGTGHDVSGVNVLNCLFLNCHRSGVSNQRAAEFLRVLHCEFEGTSDQDIDLEPTGSTANAGPRYYDISHNIMRRINFATAAVSNTGLSATSQALRNVVSYNKIFGTVGGLNIDGLSLIGNFIQPNVNDTAEALSFFSSFTNGLIEGNVVVRPAGTHIGKLFTISGSNGYYPNSVRVRLNRFHTWVGTDADACAVLLQNCDGVDFSDNDVYNYGSGNIVSAIRLYGTSANGCKNSRIDRNRVYGNLGGGSFTNGILGDAGGGPLNGLSVQANEFLGCTNNLAFSKSGGAGAFTTAPRISGNQGDGAEFASGSLAAIGKYILAGNLPGVGHFAGDGAPSFSAAEGSTYIRRDGSSGTLLYVNTSGSTTWATYA